MSGINPNAIPLDPANMEVDGGLLSQVPGTDGGANSIEQRLSRTIAINGRVAGDNLIYTASSDWVITKAIVTCTLMGAFTSEGFASIGINSPDYNDVFSDNLLDGLDNVNKSFTFQNVLGSSRVALNGDEVYFKINTPYNSGSTILVVDLFGFPL